MTPQLIFGTASFGMDLTEFQEPSSVQTLLKNLQELGIHRLDSGARYPPMKPGRAEELIGETKELSGGFITDTKVYTDTKTDGSRDLTGEAVEKSLQGSLQRLKKPDGVNILYSHRADPFTPLEEQIIGFNLQIKQGRCQTWGVSNTSPEMLEQMLRLCEEKGLQKPSCYQGDYNLVTRGMETKLLPILRAHGMTYNAFRPLAAGFLTGKLVNNEHTGTRFGDDNPLGKFAQKLFGAEDLHSAMRRFDTEAKSHNLTSIEVAIRWIAHHSALRDEDGIVLGASKVEQIRETVTMIKKGPLPENVLMTAQDLWSAIKGTRGEII
ncbi:MAG: hypothetical protein ALECFALPRED_010906 [Alectoria fallacina]|uniref:NADP-dependent oxidoreductase domain-containing protein n=1 Tax=Alectoria fallacina TaxID=1903189 RepID=A0A8H3F4A0_9LECA|nr:MAG: hypothetical protein ALECFALPRED_010906 [Alectoria fallacina]